MPRLTAAELREPLIEGAFKAVRNRGHQTVSRKSLFSNPTHRAAFREMLEEVIADPETDEVGRAAAALLKEIGAADGSAD